MTISIPEELFVFGVTSKDFDEKKSALVKSTETEVNENEVFWALFQDLVEKAINYEILQMLYWNMALFKDKLGESSFKLQQKSHQSRLLGFKKNEKKKVKINASGCCSSCGKLHNLVLPLSKALRNLPVPNPKCESTLYSDNIWCISIYLAVKDEDKESEKLPPAVKDVPKIPVLAESDRFFETDSSVVAEQIKKQAYNKKMASALLFLALSIGVGMFFFSPIAGVFLLVCSILFSPSLMLRLRRFVPFLNLEYNRCGLFGIIFLLAFVILLIIQLFDQKINTSTKNSTILSYQVLLIEDQSSSTRSRLQVRIVAPQARTARERARVVMNAAKQIHDSQVSDNYKIPKFEYISVVLEANKKTSGQGYFLAEAEFAPDGLGRHGIMSDDPENQWKWKVRSSKVRVNPNDTSSLQAVKGTLEKYLKQ